MRTNKEIEKMYMRHADTVYRVCFVFLKGNTADIEDAMQTTFLKALRDTTPFESGEHEKAWLSVTSSNVCRDMLSSAWKKRVSVNDTLIQRQVAPFEVDETLGCVMALPSRYKIAIYLFYYEGYSGKEIARVLGKKETSVWSYLSKGRTMLKKMLKEEAL